MKAEDIVFGKGNSWGLFANYHQWLNYFMQQHDIPETHPYVYEFKGKRYVTDTEYIISVLHRMPKTTHLEIKSQLERVEKSGQSMISFLETIGARLCEGGVLDKDPDWWFKVKRHTRKYKNLLY